MWLSYTTHTTYSSQLKGSLFKKGRNKMTYPGVKLFMEKLKQVIHSEYIPLINNHPSVLSKRPQFQLLYNELGSLIQMFFVDQKGDNLHDHEEVRNVKKRFKDVAEEAHDVFYQFVSVIIFKYRRRLRIFRLFDIPLNLEDVMRSIKSIKEDFVTIGKKMKMESSAATTGSLKTQSDRADGTFLVSRNSTVRDEIVVGRDHDVDIIRDKLVEDTRNLDVVSVVGMGGSCKTTLAMKVFNDGFVVYHFGVRGWVTVSQTYEKTDLLNQMLASLGVEIEPNKSRQKLYKNLMSKRYLIVIDDVYWNTEAWDDLKVLFPDNKDCCSPVVTRKLLYMQNQTVLVSVSSTS